jgi:hypothetical protein
VIFVRECSGWSSSDTEGIDVEHVVPSRRSGAAAIGVTASFSTAWAGRARDGRRHVSQKADRRIAGQARL